MRRVLATASLCAAAALSLLSVPGCAETDEAADRLSKAQYLIQLRAVVAQVRQTVRQAARFDNVSNLPELEAFLNRTVAEYGQIVDRMEAIEPPEEVADLHERLTDTLISAEGTLEDANEALQSGDLEALLGLGDEVQGLATDFSQISTDYAERGYEVGKAPQLGDEFAPESP